MVVGNAYQIIRPHLETLPQVFTPAESIVAMFFVIYFSKFIQIFFSFIFKGDYDTVHPRRESNSPKAYSFGIYFS